MHGNLLVLIKILLEIKMEIKLPFKSGLVFFLKEFILTVEI
jgi:hypothetical protein